MKIAIDGPAAAGKSTIAKTIANEIGILYIDTGAMYRAFTYNVIKNNIGIDEQQAIDDLLENTVIDFKDSQIFLNGEQVENRIRSNEVNKLVSEVSAIPKVREKLVEIQREIAAEKSCILDGRDIGTVVFPDADVKIFLTASDEIRALRRLEEMKKNGIESDFDAIIKNIKSRDLQDSTRKTSPLKQAPDAIVIDTGNKSIREISDIIISIIKEKSKDESV